MAELVRVIEKKRKFSKVIKFYSVDESSRSLL